jgi:hypothetical protein
MSQPFESCPRFERCSCNDCPLDPMSAMHGGPRLALRGEERCRASRVAREAVAVAHGHPAAWGWVPREIRREVRRARWLALPAEERERRREALALARGKAVRTRRCGQLGAVLIGVGEGDSLGVAQDKGSVAAISPPAVS